MTGRFPHPSMFLVLLEMRARGILYMYQWLKDNSIRFFTTPYQSIPFAGSSILMRHAHLNPVAENFVTLRKLFNGMDTVSEGSNCQTVYLPFEERPNSKGKEFVPTWSKLFHFKVDLFFKRS